MKSSNPVLTRLGEAAAQERAAGHYAPAGYPAAPPIVRPMTVDDVVVRTVALLALTGVAGALTWALVPDSLLGVAWIGGAMVGLVLGLVITFARVTNPFVISAYAIVEGVFVGAVSKFYETAFEGIVLQAVLGTFGLFFLMAMLFKARVIRATPRFVKGVLAALVGVFALILMNFVLSLFHINTGLRDGSPLAIGFSIVIIIVASLTFILDFAQVEEAVRYGLPQRYAWNCAFGILVGLIWLYLEILRLISYFRD
ncbi:MAG TPA: Bax inhibitor-1/YccA family protein [Micromonosporaceae bacterium]|nr:Bax inhibitor-1/YccA family protein [Micromonosporaceae bacterium]